MRTLPLQQRIQKFILHHWAHLITVLLWGGVALTTRQYLNDHDLTFGMLAESLRVTLQENWYGSLLYMVAYLFRPLTLFPSSFLTILAGNVFGLGPGFVLTLVAGTLSALPTYTLGRWFSGDNPPSNPTTRLLQGLIGFVNDHPFQAVFLMRLLYLPYDAVNVLLGYMRVPLRSYVLATALGNIPSTLAYISLGASVQMNLATGQIAFNPYFIVLSAALLVVSLGISWLFNRRQTKIEQDSSTGDL